MISMVVAATRLAGGACGATLDGGIRLSVKFSITVGAFNPSQVFNFLGA